MKKFLISVAFVSMLAATPAYAGSTFSLGTGFNFGHVNTATGAASTGTAAAGSLAAGNNNSFGAGFAAASPAGGISAGVGASTGQSGSVSGAASIGNGAAASSGLSNNVGLGVGAGFTNVTP